MTRPSLSFLSQVDETAETITLVDVTDRSLLSCTSFLGAQDRMVMRSRPTIATFLDAVKVFIFKDKSYFEY